eukprot:s240_g29.t1
MKRLPQLVSTQQRHTWGKPRQRKGTPERLKRRGRCMSIHVWAALVTVAVDYVAKADDKTVLQQHVAFHVHVARFKKAWDKKTMKLHLATHASLEPVLGSLDKALWATGGKGKSGQAPHGRPERQLQEMLDALQ